MPTAIEEMRATKPPRERLEYTLPQRLGRTVPVELQVSLREELFEQVCEEMAGDKLICLIGQKQMGKSTLIRKVMDENGSPTLLNVMDLERVQPNEAMTWVVSCITETVEELGADMGLLPNHIFRDDDTMERYLVSQRINLFELIADSVSATGRRIDIGISEIAPMYFAPDQELKKFISFLTKLAKIPNLSVTLDTHPIHRVEEILVGELADSVVLHRLGPISLEEMQPYLDALIQDDPDITFAEDAYGRMYEVTGGRPNEIAKVFINIFGLDGHDREVPAGPYEISVDDVDIGYSEYIGTAEGRYLNRLEENINPYISYLRGYSTPEEFNLIRRIASEEVPLESAGCDIERLVDYGLIEVVDDNIRFRGEICRYFFEKMFCNMGTLAIGIDLRREIRRLIGKREN
ncbi:hypothetical protein HOG48_04110 [Candidatus Peregrinibacteria bacterium]|nr:hypothetical protein [Candidatus Peregrinibacteria bacterium]